MPLNDILVFSLAAKLDEVTAERDKVDERTRSKWPRVLRYAVEFKPLDESLGYFIVDRGGINECASRFARRIGRSIPDYS
jgi:hypothetical protein